MKRIQIPENALSCFALARMGVLSILRGVATASLAGLAIAGGLLYAFQSKLIYPANLPSGSRTTVATPDEHGMPDYEEVTLTTPDGVKIRAFVVLYRGESAGIRPTVLLLHANAGNVGHRLPIARIFNINMRANVVALSYRGYGKSEGSYVVLASTACRNVSFDSLIRSSTVPANVDSDSTLKPRWTTFCRIQSWRKLKSSCTDSRLEELSRLISPPTTRNGYVRTQYFPFSLSRKSLFSKLTYSSSSQIAGLIVENTFLSLPKLVPHVMPYLAPFMFLLHQRWPSDEKVKTFPPTLPVLFLSGSSDELIPPYHVAELCRLSGGKNRLIKFPHGTHSSSPFSTSFVQNGD